MPCENKGVDARAGTPRTAYLYKDVACIICVACNTIRMTRSFSVVLPKSMLVEERRTLLPCKQPEPQVGVRTSPFARAQGTPSHTSLHQTDCAVCETELDDASTSCFIVEDVARVVRIAAGRLTFMALLGTGVVAAVCAISIRPDRVGSLGCALAASVNLIACIHYEYIIRSRKSCADSSDALAASNDEVDRLRFSDWTVTLIAMILDIHLLADQAAPTASYPVFGSNSVVWAACFQPLIVLSGALVRFGNFGPYATAGTFITGSVLFALYITNILLKVENQSGAGVDIVRYTCIVQILYPIAFGILLVIHRVSSSDKETSVRYSVVGDCVYGCLDTLSKGGLALMCAYKLRSAR